MGWYRGADAFSRMAEILNNLTRSSKDHKEYILNLTNRIDRLTERVNELEDRLNFPDTAESLTEEKV